MKFSILHPTRERPHKSLKTIEQWLDTSGGSEMEVIVSIDESDPYKNQYKEFYSKGRMNNPNIKVICYDNQNAIEAINNAAKLSCGEILIVVSDDTGATLRWDHKIVNAVVGKQDYVLKVFDGIQKWIVTMPIMDRIYYERYGYVYNPIYSHMFCDTELAHVAEITGKLLVRNDIIIPHLHYSITKEQKDPIAVKNDLTQNAGARIYMRRFKENFGLSDVNVWNISSDSHTQWLRNNMRLI